MFSPVSANSFLRVFLDQWELLQYQVRCVFVIKCRWQDMLDPPIYNLSTLPTFVSHAGALWRLTAEFKEAIPYRRIICAHRK